MRPGPVGPGQRIEVSACRERPTPAGSNRRCVGGEGHQVLGRRRVHNRLHHFGPRAATRPCLHVEQLAHQVTWRPAGERRYRAEPFQVRTVAGTALILGRELLPFVQRAARDVCRPAHARVARLRAQVVVRHLDDMIGADRLHAATFGLRDLHVHPALEAHLRSRLAFNHLDASREGLGGEEVRGGLDLVGRSSPW